MPESVDGLLAAGRNLSADTKSHAALREIPECWVMGEAAGIAATMAVSDNVAVRDVGVAELQAKLEKRGAIIDPPGDGRGREDDGESMESELEDSIHWRAVDEQRAFD